MSKPAGYIVRPEDMREMVDELNRVPGSYGDLYVAARVLVGWAELWQTQQTQPPPVSVASLALPLDEPVNVPADTYVYIRPESCDMPSPEADALDRIAEIVASRVTEVCETGKPRWTMRGAIGEILTETGRLG